MNVNLRLMEAALELWWGGGGVPGWGGVCTVIFMSNPTTVLMLCCVIVWVVTICKITDFKQSKNSQVGPQCGKL